MRRAISTLPAAELEDILREEGHVTRRALAAMTTVLCWLWRGMAV